jgi:hypothetical protein
MSTFTNVLQQRINALQNQIRYLQEHNYNLNKITRYLLESAPSTGMSMLPVADASQVPDQVGPSGQYGGNPDRYTMSTTQDPSIPGPNQGIRQTTLGQIMREGSYENGVYTYTAGVHTYVYSPGPPAVVQYYKNGELQRTYTWSPTYLGSRSWGWSSS